MAEIGRLILRMIAQVAHYMEDSAAADHRSPTWNLLTPEAAHYIRRREQDPCTTDAAWSCNHCAVHWNAFVKRAQAIEHARTTYGPSFQEVSKTDFPSYQARYLSTGRKPRLYIHHGTRENSSETSPVVAERSAGVSL